MASVIILQVTLHTHVHRGRSWQHFDDDVAPLLLLAGDGSCHVFHYSKHRIFTCPLIDMINHLRRYTAPFSLRVRRYEDTLLHPVDPDNDQPITTQHPEYLVPSGASALAFFEEQLIPIFRIFQTEC